MRICGIYCFKNLVNNKVYVGSSSWIQSRKNYHLGRLRRGVHDNVHLQRAFSLYGEPNLEFSVLVICQQHELLEKEQEFIDTLGAANPKSGYNISPTTNRTMISECTRVKLRESHIGHKHPPEVCKKISIALKNRIRGAETRKKISKALTGRKLSKDSIMKRTASRSYGSLSEETRRKISVGNIGKHKGKRPEWWRKKISDGHKGQIPWNKGRDQSSKVSGVLYA